ncbi:MAG: N-acetylmuramic acid 6-phosphate etherase, partial [Planctomycetota bacterium]
LDDVGVGPDDVVCGIATSGRTPYVVGGLRRAREAGAYTISLSCNAGAEIAELVDLSITPVVGPEVLSGSTRLKAGTATKLVLNSITTGAMVLLGKTFGNLMVDLRPTNSKLVSRALRIVTQATELPREQARELLDRCDGEVKLAIVAHFTGTTPEAAQELLEESSGQVGAAVGRDRPQGGPKRPAMLRSRSNGQASSGHTSSEAAAS